MLRVFLPLLLLVFILGWSGDTAAQNVNSYIPARCQQLEPVVSKEIDLYLPSLTYRGYFGALIEHESCISLKHSRCCSPTSRLKTSREEGAGLGQLTRAYRSDGSLRFDALSEMRVRYRSELKDLSWLTIYERPDLQVRTMILMTRDNLKHFVAVKDEFEKYAFADSSYNGGARDVRRSRTACGLAKDCDPDFWFGHTERYLDKSTRILYGNRSARDINLHHVHDVMKTRLPKYQLLYADEAVVSEPEISHGQ